MGRRKFIALGVAPLAVLLGVVALSISRSGTPAESVYSVVQVTAGLRHQPAQWDGRTVLVRGTVWSYTVGKTSLGSPPVSLSWHGMVLVDSTGGGIPTSTASMLILRGATYRPGDIIRGLAHAAARRIGLALPPDRQGAQPRVYRLHLLVPAHCPAAVASPCFTGVVR